MDWKSQRDFCITETRSQLKKIKERCYDTFDKNSCIQEMCHHQRKNDGASTQINFQVFVIISLIEMDIGAQLGLL